MFRQVEPAVQGGQKGGRLQREQRERIVVEVKVLIRLPVSFLRSMECDSTTLNVALENRWYFSTATAA